MSIRNTIARDAFHQLAAAQIPDFVRISLTALDSLVSWINLCVNAACIPTQAGISVRNGFRSVRPPVEQHVDRPVEASRSSSTDRRSGGGPGRCDHHIFMIMELREVCSYRPQAQTSGVNDDDIIGTREA